MIEARALSFAYGRVPVLSDLNLKINKGDFVGLLGPNGAGKSTLLRALSGQVPSPAVLHDGVSVERISRRQLSQQVAFVSQSLQLTFPLTGREFVTMARYSRLGQLGQGEAQQEQIVEEAMRSTQTWGFADRCVTKLSGGEWQRVRLAQALAQQPQWLFLDEPTAHLDVRIQLELMELLVRLNREQQLSIVLSLHDINLALTYCQRLLLLDRGKIVIDLPPRECAQDPALEQVFQVQFDRHSQPGSQQIRVFPIRGLDFKT